MKESIGKKRKEMEETFNDFLTVIEISIHINRYDGISISPTYIRRLCISGRIDSAYKIGGIWAVPKDSAIRFILNYNSIIKNVGKPRKLFIECPECNYEFSLRDIKK